jgi:hypothetical protein
MEKESARGTNESNNAYRHLNSQQLNSKIKGCSNSNAWSERWLESVKSLARPRW